MSELHRHGTPRVGSHLRTCIHVQVCVRSLADWSWESTFSTGATRDPLVATTRLAGGLVRVPDIPTACMHIVQNDSMQHCTQACPLRASVQRAAGAPSPQLVSFTAARVQRWVCCSWKQPPSLSSAEGLPAKTVPHVPLPSTCLTPWHQHYLRRRWPKPNSSASHSLLRSTCEANSPNGLHASDERWPLFECGPEGGALASCPASGCKSRVPSKEPIMYSGVGQRSGGKTEGNVSSLRASDLMISISLRWISHCSWAKRLLPYPRRFDSAQSCPLCGQRPLKASTRKSVEPGHACKVAAI